MLTKTFNVLKQPKKIKKLPHFLKSKFVIARRDHLFASIAEEVTLLANKAQRQKIRILYGPSFSGWAPCRVHDFLLTQALRVRRADIIPCVMGRLQFGETSYIGGHWGGAKDQSELSAEQSEKNYKRVADADHLLWMVWSKLNPIQLERYVTPARIEQLLSEANTYSLENYKGWTYQNLPVVQWALDVLCNNALVSDVTLIPHYKIKLFNYLHHILVMTEACRCVLDDVNPDIVISNDSFYYPWSILEKLCDRRDIPHYNYWPGVRKNRVCYAKGEPAMLLNMSRTWKEFKTKDLTDHQQVLIQDYLANRHTGKDLAGLNTCDPKQNAKELELFDWGKIDAKKPTALLAANVCWDLCALNKNIQFESMFDWIIQTVNLFADHPEWQLIIKPHPGEENDQIPLTLQTVKGELLRNNVKIPDNVLVLDARTGISVYELFTKVQVGLVYTSTVGLEMACLGIPVITAGSSHYHGMGFTFDSHDKETYFEQITQLLSENGQFAQKESWSELAKKFFYLYEFEYPVDLGVLEYDGQGRVSTKVKSAKDLMPGKHRGLDFICGKILKREYIF